MNMRVTGGGMELFVVLTALVGIATTIFWMVVGWRAMRAHERIAEVSERWKYLREEERLDQLRKDAARKASEVPSAEERFSPKPDAPPELPWTKEL